MGGGSDECEAALTELRQRLQDALAHQQLTKTQLAARTGLSRTTIQAAFQPGGSAPSAATISALARKLSLPAEEARELLELRRAAAGDVGPVQDEGLGKPIGQWDPHDLEVHPAGAAAAGVGARAQRALPGYVRRSHDRVLAEAVSEAATGRSRMLVLVGSSSTGKTRACWEAVQPLAAEGWRLWHPYDPTRADAALADLERVGPSTVVWLNEVQHYLGHLQAGERIAAALHTLLTHADRGPVLVLGTSWPEYADAYTALPRPGKPDPHSRVRELLTGRTLTVPDAFDQEALQAACALARGGDRFLSDALTRAHSHGRVTQELAGAPELVRRYEHGTPPVKALLQAAMDARRLGVGLHLPQAFLIDAATDYLTDDDYDQLAEDWAEVAFAALARPVPGKQAPLRRTRIRPPQSPAPASASVLGSGPVFRLADYLEQHGQATRRGLCPPASFWYAAHAHLTDPAGLHNLAHSADRRQRLKWAHSLWRKAADAGHTEALPHLARMRILLGDREGAEMLHERAANAGDMRSLTRLAAMREDAGDREGAEILYRRAADAGHTGALIGLAAMRRSAGDWEGAEPLFQRAANAGHAGAVRYVTAMRVRAGDQDGAESLYQQAADAGDSRALTSLAHIREEAGDRKGAETLYEQAANVGHTEALTYLARTREEAGDHEGAETLAQQAAEAGDTRALTYLVRAREGDGDHEGAETLARQAASAGDTEPLTYLARRREEAGDHAGAEILYRQAADASESPFGISRKRWLYGLDPDGSPTPPWH